MMPSMAQYAGLLALGAVAATAMEASKIQTMAILRPGETPPTISSSTTTSTTPSSAPASTTPATISSMKASPPATGWELTTIFTQRTECVGGITQYAGDLSTFGYWLNIPHPAPGLTLTSCFPPALVASVTAAEDLPPYDQLVCPYQWESWDYNSTYRICCPKDFGFHLPGTNKARPGLGAWCTSWARPGTHAALTRYFTDGGSSLIDTTLKATENWLVQATPFDGTIAATNAPTVSASDSASTASVRAASASKSSAVATTSSKSSAPALTTRTGRTAVPILMATLALAGAL